jgi:predicted component of viral defense system (DUF524 family)
LTFGRDIQLSYNRTFSRNRPVPDSYSLALRPDISLRLGNRLHLFDAKFRIDQWEMPDADESVVEDDALEKPYSSRTHFKSADIHKMHAYMDAILEKGSAPQTVWVLYPGTDFAFYDKRSGFRREPHSLGETPWGVGAIPLLPGHNVGCLSSAVKMLVDQM